MEGMQRKGDEKDDKSRNSRPGNSGCINSDKPNKDGIYNKGTIAAAAATTAAIRAKMEIVTEIIKRLV